MNDSDKILTYLLKDEVDFKHLKKYGFIKSWAGFYVTVDANNFIEISINPVNLIIESEENNSTLKMMVCDGLVEKLGQMTIFDYEGAKE